MRPLVLDTNVLIAFFKGDRAVAEVVSSHERVLIPTVVLGEFKSGIALDTKNGTVLRRALDSFLDAPSVEVIAVSEETTDTYALVYKVLREKGCPIPQNDIWIAAMTLDQGGVLYTKDAHFDRVPLLRRI